MATSPTPEQRKTLYATLAAAAIVTRVGSHHIFGHSRVVHIAEARHIVMWIMREFTDASFPTIAVLFGGLDHTTVLHAHRRITKKLGESESLQTTVANILALMARNEEEKRAA